MKTLLGVMLCVVLLVAAGPARGEQVVWVTVKNAFQAEVASGIVDHAQLRDGNRFLAAVTEGQANDLRRSGLAVEQVLAEADLGRTYRVMADGRAPRRAVDLMALGEAADLGGGVVLLATTEGQAEALNAEHGYLVTALADLSIRWYYAAPAVGAGLSEMLDFPTDTLSDLISQDSLFAFDSRLMNFQTRYIWSDSIDAARDWIMSKFTDWGYADVSWQEFPYGGGTHYNIVAVKPGYAEPDKVIVIGGHYDSVNGANSLTFAPGADDNGSGTAATMEMARVLAGVPLRKTIIFMPFSAEEQGLIGSTYAAQQFVADGTDLEVMFNYDMIGYDPSNARLIALSGAPFNMHYRDLMADAVSRLTDLIAVPEDSPGGSDHQPFINQGFPVMFAIEGTFNYQGWHTNTDLTSMMNFPFFTKVVQAGIASLAAVANSAHPTNIEWLADQGDGSSIEVFWSDCDPTYTYTVKWGTSPGVYQDSMVAAPGSCSQVITGLMEGQPYYFTAVGVHAEAFPPVYSTEDSLTPLVLPRAPTGLVAEPVYRGISLTWNRNPEADLTGYRIYRSISDMGFTLYQENLLEESFTDSSVLGQTKYSYRIMAVDEDGHESAWSADQSCWAATFDGGIVIVDEMTTGTGVPTQEGQLAFWDTTMGSSPFAVVRLEELKSTLTRSAVGPYSSLLWFDDDLSRKIINLSEDTLDWYAGFPENILIGGLRTVQYWGSSGLQPGDFRYDELGLAGFSDNTARDFAGAHGQAGWPDLQVDPVNFFSGPLPNIPSLQTTPGTSVIYTYDAASDDALREGQPVGLLKETPNGKRILLAFPTMFLTDSTAILLYERVKAEFGETAVIAVNGDVDNNGVVNISDLAYFVTYLFRQGPAPAVPSQADVNGNCVLQISDLAYLVSYLFRAGADPLAGCVP